MFNDGETYANNFLWLGFAYENWVQNMSAVTQEIEYQESVLHLEHSAFALIKHLTKLYHETQIN